MKRLITLTLALFCVFGLVGCETVPQRYKLALSPSASTVYLVNELQDTYAAGEEITIQLATITDHYYILTVNEEAIDMADSDFMYTYFQFTMPHEDVKIELRQKAADIPEWTEGKYPPPSSGLLGRINKERSVPGGTDRISERSF